MDSGLLHPVRSGVLALLAAIPALSHASQFVLFDVTFTYTKQDADTSTPSKSHYYVKGPMLNPDRPRDWTSPVDYRNGTVHIRAEILEKPPGGAPTTWTLCYIPNKGQGNGYGCTGTGIYREKGVYEKDGSGGSGHVHKRSDPEKFFPTKMRITVVQVSVGSKYDPSLVPNLPGK